MKKLTIFAVILGLLALNLGFVACGGGAGAVATTTGIVFTFSGSVDSFGLTAADITVGGTAAKGSATLSGTGSTRTLSPITVNSAGTATVKITKTGIEAVTKNVTVYKAGQHAALLSMVYIPGGSFQMGNPNSSIGWDDERPVHMVTLTGFYMGKYEVTQELYQSVTGNNPSSGSGYGVGNNYPVYYVSWYDALVFCNKLSMAEGLTPAYRINNSTNPSDWGSVPTSSNSTWNAVTIESGSTGYRLPTEAQWEYAAKGGNGSPGSYTYAGSNTVGDVAWYTSNSGSSTHTVGTKSPNGLGLYDMSGNVWEWCWDRYGTYPGGAQTNPTGASSGSDRVLRGGSWYYLAVLLRSAYRRYYYPSNRDRDLGFRLVRP